MNAVADDDFAEVAVDGDIDPVSGVLAFARIEYLVKIAYQMLDRLVLKMYLFGNASSEVHQIHSGAFVLLSDFPFDRFFYSL
mmetsp:Transcript_14779/g.29541  ORF Transcript_14779/g.29541 Transcript_14779/m.29541 type:complete len:82 (-) Transcript_14779:3226-3471(-)